MGAEENKPEEKKEEEVKKPEEVAKKPEEEDAKKPEEEEKKAEEAPKEPPPPEDIVLRVFMHCEGCARKVRRCLKNFEGVEDVQTDCKTSQVIVKGPKADPLKVLERVQRKSHRQVELLSPIPKPPVEGEKKEEDSKENIKPAEDKKKEEEVIITVVLKVHMHCEACAQEIQKRILRMKGVKTAESALKASEVTVKGVFDPPKLVEYVYKRTGKHAMILKTEPEPEPEKKEEEKPKEENAEKKEEGEKAEGEKKEGEGAEAKAAEEEAKKPEAEETTKTEVEVKKNEFYYYPLPKYNTDYYPPPQVYPYQLNPYPPQIFSDENPNACSVM